MSAALALIGLTIGCFVIVIAWTYWDYRNDKKKKSFFENLDKTLIGLLVILFFILGLYLAYFI